MPLNLREGSLTAQTPSLLHGSWSQPDIVLLCILHTLPLLIWLFIPPTDEISRNVQGELFEISQVVLCSSVHSPCVPHSSWRVLAMRRQELHWNCFNQQTFEENINSSRNCYKPDGSLDTLCVYCTTLAMYHSSTFHFLLWEWDGYELITLASEWFWSGVVDCELTAECGSQHQKTDRFIPAWLELWRGFPHIIPTFYHVATLHVYKHLVFLL